MKFELTAESINHYGRTLYRIRALVSFGSVVSGEMGGYVEKADNLSQDGNAWVFGNARVFGNAEVSGDAEVSPINIIGLAYNVTITDSMMQIGCEFHSHDEWRNFENGAITQMDGTAARRFWDAHRQTLLALCAHHAEAAEKAKVAA